MEYKQGREQGSRCPVKKRRWADFDDFSGPIPSCLEEIPGEYKENPELMQMVQDFEDGTLDPSKYSMHDGILFYKGRIHIGSQSPIRHRLLTELHDAPIGILSGLHKTYNQVKRDLHWCMKVFVKEFGRGCYVGRLKIFHPLDCYNHYPQVRSLGRNISGFHRRSSHVQWPWCNSCGCRSAFQVCSLFILNSSLHLKDGCKTIFR